MISSSLFVTDVQSNSIPEREIPSLVKGSIELCRMIKRSSLMNKEWIVFLSDFDYFSHHAMTSPVDTLTSNDIKELLYDKYILILGDSVVRGLYKDLIKFSNSDDLLNEEELRIKGENRFYGDRLIHGGVQKGLTNGTDYEEVREYTAGGRFRIRFYFLTRSYSSYIKDAVFNDMKNQAIKPDIIIMNSCLWDISRYGIYSMKSYQRNIDRIMGSFRQILPKALFLWLSALPVSNSSKGGVIVSRAEYIRPILPGLIRDGNYYCSQMCDIHGVLYVDFHTIFSTMLHLRRPDGIHWSAIGTRLMNEMILNHIKAYYHGVKDFQCPLLRGELGKKINTFKQQMKRSKHSPQINYLDQDISDDDDHEEDEIDHYRLSKRKRNENDDEEKENERYHRKVIIKSSIIKNEQRMVVIRRLIDHSEVKQQDIIEKKFDHEFCDIMFDNEYEGLHLLHFSSYDVEPSEEINHHTIQIQYEQTVDNTSEIDIKPSKDSLSIPLTTPIEEEMKADEHDYIILSSDDEDESTAHIVPSSSPTAILPIYLLNRL